MRACSVPNCDLPHYAKSYCKGHYSRWRNHGDPVKGTPRPRDLRRRLKYDVDPDTGCWVWAGHVNEQGYGRLSIQGRMTMAHRLAYGLLVGPIPMGLLVLHRCDNPPCVNPDHLWVGTHLDNMADMRAKDRQARARRNANPNAKLTDREVAVIQMDDTRTAAELAEAFGVSVSLVEKLRALPAQISCPDCGANWGLR